MRLLVLLAFLSGCSTLHPQWPRDDAWHFREGTARFTVDRGIDQIRETRLRFAAQAHQRAFALDYGKPPEHEVAVIDDQVRCGITLEKEYWGCTIGRAITLTTGGPPTGAAQGAPPDSLPSYYHELFHLIVPEDLDHGDQRWPVVDRRNAEVVQGLR